MKDNYDSIEEFFEDLAANTAEANQHLAEKQRDLTWGSDAIRFLPDGLVIFGHVYTEDEMFASEGGNEVDRARDPVERAMLMSEVSYTMDRVRERQEDGFLYGWWSSAIEPGEPGSVHKAVLWPIEHPIYLAAQQAGWQVPRLDNDNALAVAKAYVEFRQHVMHEYRADI